jgi:catechol 2,3-dioxygenase-like lactoylglutathione lyase family enzyme
MAVKLHHLIVPAQDKLASAQLFAEIFGLTVKPSEGRFAQVPVDEHLTIDFADDEHIRGLLHFVPEQLESHHYAFHVTDEEFDGIFGRVKAKGLAYGSGPTRVIHHSMPAVKMTKRAVNDDVGVFTECNPDIFSNHERCHNSAYEGSSNGALGQCRQPAYIHSLF